MALLSQRHKELEDAWFTVVQEMKERKLPFLNPAED
jgi:hypothetical protein